MFEFFILASCRLSLSLWFIPHLTVAQLLITFVPHERNCNLAFNKHIYVSLQPLSIHPASHVVIFWSLMFSLHLLWSHDVTAARLSSELFGFPDWFRGIFLRPPAVQNICCPRKHIPVTWWTKHTHRHISFTPPIQHIYTENVSPDLNLPLHSLRDALGLNWTAECVWLFVFLYSSDPDVNIPLQNTVTFTLMCIQIRFYMKKNTRIKISAYKSMFQTSKKPMLWINEPSQRFSHSQLQHSLLTNAAEEKVDKSQHIIKNEIHCLSSMLH